MGFQKRLNKWFLEIRKYFFLYKDGYYELPYLSNSPQVMVASLKKVPFTKHSSVEQAIYSKNPFTQAVMYYRELSEGLWVLATEMTFKKSIATKALHDNEPSDYYFLSHFRYHTQVNTPQVNGVSLPKTGWSLYKPGTDITSYFNEGDHGVFLIFAFSKQWFAQNISLDNLVDQGSLKSYLDSDQSMIVWEDVVANSESMTEELLATIKQKDSVNFNQLSLKIQVLKIISSFLIEVTRLPQNGASKELSESDRRHLAIAESILLKSLTTSFPGIESLAEKVHMSATKLKANFKIIYGKTLFQYYQEKQMQLALELLKEKKNSVKEVAFLLGYENPSNFRSAFKKYFDYVPSEIE